MRRLAIVVIVIGSLVAGALLLGSGWTPAIPPEAASAVLARATSESETTADCLERIERAAGWLDLCWQVDAQVDGDGAKDHYRLRVAGTLSGESGGVRWWALRARLVDTTPADSVFFGWPEGRIDGACTVHGAPAWQDAPYSEVICGRTVGDFAGPHEYQVEWSCVGCILPDHSERSVALYYLVAVPAGSAPAWEIGADFGA